MTVFERDEAEDMDWCEFRVRLLAALRTLGPRDYLIIEAVDNWRFVQIAIDEVAHRIESVADTYLLDPQPPLTATHHAVLAELGYAVPTHEPEEPSVPGGSPNYWMDVPVIGTLGRVTQVMVETLRRVHDVAEPAGLRYNCFNGDFGSLALPELGIPRCEPY